MKQKLFIVTKTDSGYHWSTIEWVKYFLCDSKETLEAVIRYRYGELDHYYHHDEAESHITIEEVEAESLLCQEIKKDSWEE